MASLRLLSSLLWLLLSASNGQHVKFSIKNDFDDTVDINWVSPDDKQLHLMVSLSSRAGFKLDSYEGHEFLVTPLSNSSRCEGQSCRAASFVATSEVEQKIQITPEFEVVRIDQKNIDEVRTHQKDIHEDPRGRNCQAKASTFLKHASLSETTEWYLKCMEASMTPLLEQASVESSLSAKTRIKQAEALENYTCTNVDAPATELPEPQTWISDIPRDVYVLHNRPSSQIHVIENFISPWECLAMEVAAKPTLAQAVVADGKGGSQFSMNRRAKQASVQVNETSPQDIINLGERVYEYVNHVLNLNLTHDGQEPIMSIQYFGKGLDYAEPDRYTPHCDGDCTGLPHKRGTRIATMVMYCTLPTAGGKTNFGNAGHLVQPKTGNAIFFSYINPETKEMDNKLTQHSGCPVYEGSKRIVTHWIRYGVSKEEPWTSFNSLGIKKSEAENQ